MKDLLGSLAAGQSRFAPLAAVQKHLHPRAYTVLRMDGLGSPGPGRPFPRERGTRSGSFLGPRHVRLCACVCDLCVSESECVVWLFVWVILSVCVRNCVSMYVKNERLCPCVKIACIHRYAKNYVHVCVCRMRSVLLRLCPIVKDCMHTYICEELHTCVCVCVCRMRSVLSPTKVSACSMSRGELNDRLLT
jgi:hypothetical protein